MEYRRKNDTWDITGETPTKYEDNVIQWYEAINDKIQKNRELKSIAQVFYKNQNLLVIAPLQENSVSLLARLSFAERYLPVLERMTENRKREWLTIRVLLKELLGEEKEIRYDPLGKPYLPDNSFNISISHTQGYAALILNKEKEVAVDIEYITPRIEKVRSRFVNEEEEKFLSQKQLRIHLLLHWSAKESLFKLLNKENVNFKTQLHIRPFEPTLGKWHNFAAYETRTEKQDVFTIHYFVHKDYVATYI
jgi:4'-phosphopantetheinyl transferase EntD